MSQSIPIYVVSLASAKLRRERMCRHLDALGLEYTVVDAVDGRLLPQGEVDALLAPGVSQPRGAIGCYASHVLIYKQILAKNQPMGLIIEDDARLDRRFARVIRDGFSNHDFDYIFLDCEKFNAQGPVFFDNDSYLDLGAGFRAHALSGGPESTHALIISASAARIRNELAFPIRGSIDVYTYLPHPFRFHALVNPKGAYLSEDSLVSFTSSRDQRAARPRFAALRRYRPFLMLKEFCSPEYWRSYAEMRARLRDGRLAPGRHWRPLPSGRNILEVEGHELDGQSL